LKEVFFLKEVERKERGVFLFFFLFDFSLS